MFKQGFSGDYDKYKDHKYFKNRLFDTYYNITIQEIIEEQEHVIYWRTRKYHE